MKRVLVTGASGFVGRSLVTALAHNGYSVRAATRSRNSISNIRDVAVVPDFVDGVNWGPILDDVQIVIHAAGLAHPDAPMTSGIYDRVNRVCTQDLARAAARAGVERFIFLSSIRAQVDAYAKYEIREIDEPRPTDRYGASKLAAESAVRAADIPYTILRPVVVYGPNPKGNMATVMRLANLPLPLPFGALFNRRSLLAIDNLLSAILFVAKSPQTISETYVLADAEPISVRDMFRTLRSAYGRSSRQLPIPPKMFEFALAMVNRSETWKRLGCELVVNPRKLMSAGWSPIINTYSGLTAMVQAHASPADTSKFKSLATDHSPHP